MDQWCKWFGTHELALRFLRRAREVIHTLIEWYTWIGGANGLTLMGSSFIFSYEEERSLFTYMDLWYTWYTWICGINDLTLISSPFIFSDEEENVAAIEPVTCMSLLTQVGRQDLRTPHLPKPRNLRKCVCVCVCVSTMCVFVCVCVCVCVHIHACMHTYAPL